MLRRLLILDFFLVVLLAMGIWNVREQWTAYDATHQVAFVRAKAESLPPLPSASVQAGPAAADWTEIPSKNLFSFDRTDIVLVAPQEPAKPSGPKPVLFGTMSLGAGRMAMVGPGQQPGNRSYRPMKVGETIDGWTITEIQEKAIIVAANDVTQTVIMNDPTAQVPRSETRTSGSGQPAPVYVAPAPAPAAATPAGAKRTRVIQTIFGPKVVEDPPEHE